MQRYPPSLIKDILQFKVHITQPKKNMNAAPEIGTVRLSFNFVGRLSTTAQKNEVKKEVIIIRLVSAKGIKENFVGKSSKLCHQGSVDKSLSQKMTAAEPAQAKSTKLKKPV